MDRLEKYAPSHHTAKARTGSLAKLISWHEEECLRNNNGSDGSDGSIGSVDSGSDGSGGDGGGQYNPMMQWIQWMRG